MSGSWHIYRPGERWQKPRFQMRIVIENSDYVAVGFLVPVAHMHTASSLVRDTRIPGSAMDVLSAEFDAEEAVVRVLGRGNEEIGDVLLHQHVMAGVGNVFKSEICFVTGLNPFRLVATLTREQVAAAVAAARRLVGANVLEDSGDTIVTYGGRGRRTTHETDPGAGLWVYGRNGEPCRRCGERIRAANSGAGCKGYFLVPRVPADAGWDGRGWVTRFRFPRSQKRDLGHPVVVDGSLPDELDSGRQKETMGLSFVRAGSHNLAPDVDVGG